MFVFGFTKIHIDTSMKVSDDDPNTRLSDETIARRGATLAKVCEEAYQELLQKKIQKQFTQYISSVVKFQFQVEHKEENLWYASYKA